MEGPDGISRRMLLKSGALTGLAAGEVALAAPADAAPALDGRQVECSLRINGQTKRLRIDPRTTLLDLLRERLGIVGTKKGCDHGQCGACTVHVGGQPVLSCLTLALSVSEPVTTIEGLGSPDRLHPMQQAFIDHDAFQCGYCTPGQIMAAVALARDGSAMSESDVREGMSGNLCRCAAYPNIVAAVMDGARRMRGSPA